MMAETSSEEAFCAIHGLPITYQQFGARIQGTIETKEKIGMIDIYICSECLKVIQSNVEGGLGGAKRKLEKLKVLDAIGSVGDNEEEEDDDGNLGESDQA